MKTDLSRVIQDLAFYNQMVNLLGYGSRSIEFQKSFYPNIEISVPRLPQWAFDILKDKISNAMEESKTEIDKIALQKYNEALDVIKNN